MYVCICRAVPEEAVRAVAARGLSVEDVRRVTGAGTSCGRCAEVVASVVDRFSQCSRTGVACTGCRGDGPSDGERRERSAA